MNICTICDHKYLHHGLALYSSLKKTCTNGFTLHWLCMDSVIHRSLQKLALSEVVLYSLDVMESIDPDLRKMKNNPASRYGDEHSQYCWALTPYFINYLLETKEHSLLYCDADIFFYQNPQTIFGVIGSGSVGIHTHRFSGMYQSHVKLADGIGTDIDVGWYNVGVMAFQNNIVSRNISQTWKSWLMKTNHCFYEQYGTCGDQKYLELFVPLFGKDNIYIFDQEGNICHKAPWCTDPCGSDILFYHFSHFNYDLQANTWRDHNNVDKPEWRPADNPAIRPLYEQYFETIKEVAAWIKK